MEDKNLQKWETNWTDCILSDQEVHVWKFDLEAHDEILEEYLLVLSDDEREKAGQFKFTLHHDRYILSRGILRHLLAAYLRIQPSQVQITYNAFGKPYCNVKDVFFNASCSENLLIIGFSKENELGIDVEFTNRKMGETDIADRFFSSKEIHQFKALEASEKIEAFYSCWTKKEAYVKAKGEGLSIPLDSFSVDIAFQEKSRILSSEHLEDDGPSFCFYSFLPSEHVIACLAIPNDRVTLRFFDGSHILNEKRLSGRSLNFF